MQDSEPGKGGDSREPRRGPWDPSSQQPATSQSASPPATSQQLATAATSLCASSRLTWPRRDARSVNNFQGLHDLNGLVDPAQAVEVIVALRRDVIYLGFP